MLAPTPPSSSLLQGLNERQRTAVTWPARPVLVLAGAGSGKTRVLTTRIAWLLHNGSAGIHSIMAVTFTNKAAKEMQIRLSAMLPVNIRTMWIGTFHSLCHRFLRLHHRAAGLPAGFQILDSADQLSLVKRLLKAQNIPEEKLTARTLQTFINTNKEQGIRAHNIEPANAFEKIMIECFAEYDRICRRDGLADFAELMLRCYEVLQEDETLRRHYQSRFHHILIDEFQDTNRLQYAWLKLLAGGGAAVFAVGDDDQSIYRFRGAEVGNMFDLLHTFNIGEPVKLEQNYRSTGNILAAANALISHNRNRLGKNLHTDSGNGEPVRFLAAATDEAEAAFAAEEIRQLHQEGLPLAQTAILYRNNAQSRILEHVLLQNGLPYRIYGGLRFFERQEVKHVLAYLRLAVNPDDDNALLRIINTPARGIGIRTVENLQNSAAEQGIPLFSSACTMAVKNQKIAAFVRLIEDFRQQLIQLPLHELIDSIIRNSGLYDDYRKQKDGGHDRLDNLEELVRAASDFRADHTPTEHLPADLENSPVWPALAFLSNAALESGGGQAADGEDAVQLMTVHSAKGLEFDTVFLTGMEEGRFPSELSLQEAGGLEEERRLMYVALTRARRRLYISMAQYRHLNGQHHYGLISRFVEEIPPELIRNLSAKIDTGKPKTITATPPQPAHRPPADYGGFHIGQNVRHPKFGVGVIIDAGGTSDNARLTVNFGHSGIKELDTRYAKLETV